jgi:hypothetical protein
MSDLVKWVTEHDKILGLIGGLADLCWHHGPQLVQC